MLSVLPWVVQWLALSAHSKMVAMMKPGAPWHFHVLAISLGFLQERWCRGTPIGPRSQVLSQGPWVFWEKLGWIVVLEDRVLTPLRYKMEDWMVFLLN